VDECEPLGVGPARTSQFKGVSWHKSCEKWQAGAYTSSLFS
jgi:hypothetical protein